MKPPLSPTARAIARESKRERKTARGIARHNREVLREHYRIGNPDTFTSDDYWLFVVSCFGVVLVMAAMAALNTVLPDIAVDTNANQSQLTWIVDAYTLALAGLLLPAGAIGDRFGRKGIFIGGLIIFTAGSLIPIWTTSANSLIAARVISGLGAAFVMPSTLSILASRVPVRRRAIAIAIWGASAGVGAVLGLVGSGLILLKFQWHAIFVALAAFAALIAILSFTIEESKEHDPPRFDPIGAVLSSVGITALVLGLIEAPVKGWGSAFIIICFVASVVFIAAFIVWELRCSHPLLDVRLFADPGFGSGSLSLMVQFAATFGVFYTIVQYLQLVQGFSPIKSAFSMAPLVPPSIIFALLSIWVTRKIGQKWLLVLGHLILAASLLMYIPLNQTTGFWYVGIIQLVFATGIGLTAAPATTAIMLQTPEKKYGVASAVNDAAREIGAALGIAMAGSILATIYSDNIADYAQKVRAALTISEQAGMAPHGTSATAYDAIVGSLPGARAVAEQLMNNPMTQQMGHELFSQGKDAFIDGQFTSAMALAGLQIVTALIMAIWAPGYKVMKSRNEQEAIEAAIYRLPIPLTLALDRAAEIRHLLVASDFDGTLAPLVKDPNKSIPLSGSMEALDNLAALPHTKSAIVSGRDLPGLRKVATAPGEIMLVGSHGEDISGQERALTKVQEQLLDQATKKVEEVAAAIPRARVEHKKWSVCLHLRGVRRPEDAKEQLVDLEEQLSNVPGLYVSHGKLVTEVSVTNTTKDQAARRISRIWRDYGDAIVYLGDDATDEIVFRNLARYPDKPDEQIITIKVGEGDTDATYRVEDELEATAALDYLARARDAYSDTHFTRVDRKEHKQHSRSRKVKRVLKVAKRK